MGYVPDVAARSLKSRTSSTIGMVFSNTQSRYYGSVLPAVNSVARRRGFTVIFGDSVDSAGVPQPDLERTLITSLVSNRVVAVVLVAPLSVDSVKTLERWNIPVVLLDAEPAAGAPPTPSVVTDNFTGAQLAGEHLVSHGYRSFMFVGHSSIWPSRQEREDGFLSAVNPHWPTMIVEGGFTAEQAERAILSVLSTQSDPPDAIFTSNDVMLAGAMSAMKLVGLKPGDDVGVISFDEFEWAAMIDPPVTTVDQHIDQLGCRAAETVLDLAEGKISKDSCPLPRLQPDLIIRESCGCSSPVA
jgi:LacI family transcriptional regulator